MRILHVTFMYPTPQKPLNGVAVEALVNAIHKTIPHSSQVIIHLTNQIKEDIKGTTSEGIQYFRIKLPLFYKYIHFYNSSKIEKLIAGYEFDIIHFHNFFPGVFLLNSYIHKTKVPYIITFRGSCARAMGFMYRHKTLRKIIENAKDITFLSEYYYRIILLNLHGYDISPAPDKFHFIPNFKPDHWQEGSAPLQISSPFRLLVIANIEKRKNLLNTLAAIQKARGQYGIEVTICGAIYDQQLFNALQTEFGDGVKFLQPLPNEEIKAIIEYHHALILLAHEETFGIAYIEAILRKRPIIYSMNAGIAGFIKHDRYGIAVKNVKDTDEISGAIISCINNYNNFDFKGNEKFLESEVMGHWHKIYKP